MSTADRIHALGRFSGAPGLHRIRALCAALGDPQDRLRFVHLAGTNGKGSTATMLAQVMQRAGFRTGLFTSPFLITFRERIQINGKLIDEETLSRLFRTVMDAAQTLTLPEGEHIGEFECVTALAFLYFAEQDCDLVILETGLGGAFDATNVIRAPEAAVITSVSLDHTAVLGETVAEIAQTKAGIFKVGSAHITAPGQHPDVLRVLREAAPDLIEAPAAATCCCTLDRTVICWGDKQYTLQMIGRFQAQNAATALTALQALRARGWQIPEQAVREGLAQAHIAGRMQVLGARPAIIVDGAHNPDGMRQFSNAVKEFAFPGKIRLVIGMCTDKSVASTVKAITFPVKTIYATPLQNERTLSADALAAQFAGCGAACVCCADCASALQRARQDADPEDTILVCGSLYLVGEAEKILSGRQDSAQ